MHVFPRGTESLQYSTLYASLLLTLLLLNHGHCCVVAQSVYNSLKTYKFNSATTQHLSECTSEQLNLQEETRVLIQLCTCAQYTNYSVLHNTT